MSSSVERFKNRKKVMAKAGIATHVDLTPSCPTAAPTDGSFFGPIDTDCPVSDAEVQALLSEIRGQFDKTKIDALIQSCKDSVIHAIAAPFGLGMIVAQWDKEGGNVDTIHNVREGVYATEEERKKYEGRGEYEPDDYHQHEKYKKKNAEVSELKENGELVDVYTGKTIDPKAKTDLDHVKSAKEVHDDAGRILAELDGPELANADSNLQATSAANNRAKKAMTVDEYYQYLQKTAETRRAEIQELKAKETLTPKEKKRLKSLEEKEAFDYQKAKAADEKARKEYEEKVNKAYYTSRKFAVNVVATGAVEGVKLGFQQAIGLVFCEFFYGAFDEVKDIFKNGFSGDAKSFCAALKKRLMRIAKRIQNKWKDILHAFGEGFFSGFLSNLVTVIINIFVKTTKNVVRMIREGFFSILKAMKTLCCPPEGLTPEQAAHETTKIIASGIVVVGCISLEEYIGNMLASVPILGFISGILTSIVIGTVTGLGITLTAYLLDKIDLFGVIRDEKHAFVMTELDQMIDADISSVENLVGSLVF